MFLQSIFNSYVMPLWSATLYVYLVIKHYKIINFKDIQTLVPEFTLLPQLRVRERVICLFIILQIL